MKLIPLCNRGTTAHVSQGLQLLLMANLINTKSRKQSYFLNPIKRMVLDDLEALIFMGVK